MFYCESYNLCNPSKYNVFPNSLPSLLGSTATRFYYIEITKTFKAPIPVHHRGPASSFVQTHLAAFALPHDILVIHYSCRHLTTILSCLQLVPSIHQNCLSVLFRQLLNPCGSQSAPHFLQFQTSDLQNTSKYISTKTIFIHLFLHVLQLSVLGNTICVCVLIANKPQINSHWPPSILVDCRHSKFIGVIKAVVFAIMNCSWNWIQKWFIAY